VVSTASVLATLAISLVFGIAPGTALAFSTNWCDTSSHNIKDYISAHCAYNGAYHKPANSYLYLYWRLDYNEPANIRNQMLQAAQNWTSSPANVVLTSTCSTCLPAQIRIVAQDPPWTKFDTNANCLGTWAATDFSTAPDHSTVYLNYHYWDSSHASKPDCNIAGWLTTGVHEMGHAMGLDHNNINTNPHQIMNACSGYTCSNRATTPQSIDVWIFNLKYPFGSAT
jgi:hypothetical protein